MMRWNILSGRVDASIMLSMHFIIGIIDQYLQLMKRMRHLNEGNFSQVQVNESPQIE